MLGTARLRAAQFVLDASFPNRNVPEIERETKPIPGGINIRRPILVGVVLVISLLVALIVWRETHAVKIAEPVAAPMEKIATDSTTPESAPATRVRPQTPEPVPTDSDVAIVFYGKLEDQSAEPVVGAEITGTTIFQQGASKAEGRFVATSDANGLFTLNAGAGQSLEVTPRKAGYALASTNNVQMYTSLAPENERLHPDSNNPVVIKMWKLQGSESLSAINQQYRFPYTNAPLFFDFLTQEIVPSGGDIKITIIRPPDSFSFNDPQGWRVEIEGVEGGLMQTSLENWKTTYWAPVDGYIPKIALPMSEDVSQNSESLDAILFVQTREGGVYTKLAIKITLNDAPDSLVNLDLHGITNTNGSCNWEGDPATFRPE